MFYLCQTWLQSGLIFIFINHGNKVVFLILSFCEKVYVNRRPKDLAVSTREASNNTEA